MVFNYSRKIYLGDTDAAGVVYFARGIEICHEAYEESLAKAGISLKRILREKQFALPIKHAAIDFFGPLFCGDQIQVHLDTHQINHSEFAIAYKIFVPPNLNRILVKAHTHHICIHPDQRTRLDLPMKMLDWLKKN